MQLHQRMMADPVIRARFEADTAMQRLMREVMAMPSPGVTVPKAGAKPAAAPKPSPAKPPAKKKPPAKPMPPMPGMKQP